jgi:hypothetical protein
MAGWSSGWVNTDGTTTVANGATLNFTHGLGTTDLTLSIFLADDQAGTNARFIGNNSEKGSSGTIAYDAQIKNLSLNSLTVQLGSGGYFDITTAGAIDTGNSKNFVGTFIKVVAISAVDPAPVPGTGDLCKLLPNGDGYQMFRNGLTIQWVSSGPFTDQDQAQTVNFPIAFAADPLKVVCSTRNPDGRGLSGVINIETTSSNKSSVTLMSQAEGDKPNSNRPYFADIIAIGIAEVTDCPGAIGADEDPEGIKVSELVGANSLKDEDLFLISRDNETDGIFDTSNNVTFEQIKEGVINSIPPVDLNNEFISFLSPSICTRGFTNSAGVAGELTFWHDNDWMHPVFNGLSVNLLTKEVYERYYWHRNFGKEAFYSRSNNTFYNPHGYSSPSAVMWDNSTPATFSTQDASLGLVPITVNRK